MIPGMDYTPPEDSAAMHDPDRLLHDPARLSILSVLRPTGACDYTVLVRVTGLSKGNLSNHFAKLEAACVVEVRKRFVGKRPTTTVCLTLSGAERLEAYWESVTQLGWESRPLHGPESFLGGNIGYAHHLAAQDRQRQKRHAELVRDPEVEPGNPVTRIDPETVVSEGISE